MNVQSSMASSMTQLNQMAQQKSCDIIEEPDVQRVVNIDYSTDNENKDDDEVKSAT